MRRAVLATTLLALLASPVSEAGTGTYTAGNPDTIELRVLFMYDEPDPVSFEPLFNEASRLLYNATEKQVRFSKIIVYNNCSKVSRKADVHIYDDSEGASAHVGGLGRSGRRIRLSQTHKTVTTSGAGDRGQLGLVHEIGHYAFALLDEYLDKKGNRTSDAFCIDAGGTTASLMDSGTTVQPENERHEFCWSGNHRTGKTRQDKKRRIGGFFFGTPYEDTDSWTWLAAYAQDRYGATLTLPTSDPVDDAGGHGADPVFEYHDCSVRAVACIDRSGSMAASTDVRAADGAEPYEGSPLWLSSRAGRAPIDLAKQGASNFITLLEEIDRAAVTSFNDSARVDYAMNDMTAANKTAAASAISLISASGTTNIGGGLQASLGQITGDGDPSAAEIVVLLSDGQHNTGTPPDSVLPSLKQRGVTVHTIGLGSVDAALMSRIARETGGTYLFASSARQLSRHFISLLREARSEGLVGSEEGELTGGSTSGREIRIDAFTAAETAQFILVWDDPAVELDLLLERPDGGLVAPGDPGVTFFYDSQQALKTVTVEQPPAGVWQAAAGNPDPSPVGFTLQVHSTSTVARLDAGADREVVTYPEPLRIEAAVAADAAIAGAEVRGRVVRPVGLPVPIRLYDDGELIHGDAVADDGLYSTLFRVFSGDGSYTVELTADTEGGVTAAEGEDGPPVTPQPVERFIRETVFSTVVEGMAVADGDLDGVSSSEEDAAPGGDGNGDGTADSTQSAVVSLRRATDSGYLTLEAVGAGCNRLSGTTAVLPAPPPEGEELPYGAVSFVLECADGVVALFLHEAGAMSDIRVLRYGPTPDDPADHWYEFSYDGRTGAEVAGDLILLHLKDGERGDDALAADGLVVVGQLAFVPRSHVPVVDIPTLSPWGIVSLTLAMGLGGLLFLRRRRFGRES